MDKIADILTRKYPQFNTVVQGCLVSDALYQMCSENVDFLIVKDDDKFEGVITDHDIASKILFENRPLNQIRVKEFMSKTLPVTTPETTLEQCLQLMERYNVRHIVVFEQFIFRGVVSLYDLIHETLTSRSAAFDEQINKRQGYPWNY